LEYSVYKGVYRTDFKGGKMNKKSVSFQGGTLPFSPKKIFKITFFKKNLSIREGNCPPLLPEYTLERIFKIMEVHQ